MPRSSVNLEQVAPLELEGPLRVCVALAAGRAEEILRAGRPIAAMLDDVDAKTPPSQFLHANVVALRFSRRFIDQASEDPRLGAVISMQLRLAAELGLVTLTERSPREDVWMAPGAEADYVLSQDARSWGADVEMEAAMTTTVSSSER